MEVALYIGLGSAIGGMARYGLSGIVAERVGASFPWGTLIVNVLGCFVIGLFFGVTGSWELFLHAPVSHQVATYGFLGGFTTFSTFSLEVINLTREGNTARAVVYVIAMTVLGLLAVTAGYSLAV